MRRLARKLAKPLALILMATQLLLAVPAGASGSVDSHCAGMSAHAASHHCPCCRDGVDSMKDCLASCTLAAAIAPGSVVVSFAPPQRIAFDEPRSQFPLSSDPPLKPPPIA